MFSASDWLPDFVPKCVLARQHRVLQAAREGYCCVVGHTEVCHRDATYATIVGMKETILTLLSIAAILGGIVLIVDAFKPPSSGGEVLFGVLLLVAGLTRFYMRSRFYKRKSN